MPDENMGREAALAHLQDLTTLIEAAKIALRATAVLAKADRATWGEIGEAAGLSTPDAFKRWHAAYEAYLAEREDIGSAS